MLLTVFFVFSLLFVLNRKRSPWIEKFDFKRKPEVTLNTLTRERIDMSEENCTVFTRFGQWTHYLRFIINIFNKFVNFHCRIRSARMIWACRLLHRLVAPIFYRVLCHTNRSFVWCWWHCVFWYLTVSRGWTCYSVRLPARPRFHSIEDVWKIFRRRWLLLLIDVLTYGIWCYDSRFKRWRS